VTVKGLYASLLVAAVVAFTGCNGKSTSGGPGATNKESSKGTHVGQTDNSFKLSTPTLATKLKQSENKVATISIKRGKNFDQDVTLKFEGLPQGVSIDPANPVLKHGEEEVKVTIKAADDAAVGDFTVKVVGHPKEGPDAVSDLKLEVSKK
jgi:uncharacterized membrane protein